VKGYANYGRKLREGKAMVQSIMSVLIERDKMSKKDAENLIKLAVEDLRERLAEGDMPFDICFEWFGLEPDYIEELINRV